MSFDSIVPYFLFIAVIETWHVLTHKTVLRRFKSTYHIQNCVETITDIIKVYITKLYQNYKLLRNRLIQQIPQKV